MVKFKKDLTIMLPKSSFLSSVLQLVIMIAVIYGFSKFACSRDAVTKLDVDYSVHKPERILIAEEIYKSGNIKSVVDKKTCMDMIQASVDKKLDSLQTSLEAKVTLDKITEAKAKAITEDYVKSMLGY